MDRDAIGRARWVLRFGSGGGAAGVRCRARGLREIRVSRVRRPGAERTRRRRWARSRRGRGRVQQRLSNMSRRGGNRAHRTAVWRGFVLGAAALREERARRSRNDASASRRRLRDGHDHRIGPKPALARLGALRLIWERVGKRRPQRRGRSAREHHEQQNECRRRRNRRAPSIRLPGRCLGHGVHRCSRSIERSPHVSKRRSERKATASQSRKAGATDAEREHARIIMWIPPTGASDRCCAPRQSVAVGR